jgi:cold-inducible RNA-binding protein
MASRLYIGGLSYSTTSDGLRRHFEQCGTVTSAEVVTDRDTNRSRGFGFVEMASAAEAKEAIARLNGQPLDGRSLRVDEAKARNEGGGGSRGQRRW